MSVFTVYCHGTGYNRKKGESDNELVAWFHNNTVGDEATLHGADVTLGNYLINEGPGHSGDDGIALPQQINPITGDRKRSRSPLSLFGRRESSFASHLMGNHRGPRRVAAQLHGLIDGEGWDENVIRTINIIQELKFGRGRPIDTVNMVGWSRGAVTCMRIAYKMQEVFGDEVQCNIFAVDPVAGRDAGKKMVDTQSLGSNVKRFVAILSMHETRSTFSPQDWHRIHAPWTTTVFLPMPGVHHAPVMECEPVRTGQITRHLAYALLRDWGTRFEKKPYAHLGDATVMCLAYADLVNSLTESPSYGHGMVMGRVTGGTTCLRTRDFARHSKMDTYTHGGRDSYWINEHHRACFAQAFPAVYDVIFGSIVHPRPISLNMGSRFASRFVSVLEGHPRLLQSLQMKGLVEKVAPWKYLTQPGIGRYLVPSQQSWPSSFPLHA